MELGRTFSALTAVLAEQTFKSGRGQPHSKTLARYPKRLEFPQGFGARLSSAAFKERWPDISTHLMEFESLTSFDVQCSMFDVRCFFSCFWSRPPLAQ
jgi:hypothetical protein